MFNEKLNGFAKDLLKKNDEQMNEQLNVLKELSEIYERLKHFPGKHNQEDHAWNKGNMSKKKRKPSKSRPGGSSSVRNSRSSKTSAGSFLRGVGISSPFEASRAAANQGRTLGVKNIVGLMKSVTTGTTMLRQWADKFRTAMSMGDEKLKQEVVDGFKKLSKELTKLSESLSDDIVAQNAFRAIVQSFQDNMSITNPEVKKIFADYPLYESDTPDAKIASQVGTTIDKNSVSEK
jgi:hypothetical protein